ncbi:MAG: amidohydrolase family protein [Acidimicrobiia bacterium]|nr:amidohydrolase family protein [Acidimicrobiia bacterium]
MTIDVHAHCIPETVMETLSQDGERFGIQIIGDGDRRQAVVAGRVTTGPLRGDLVDLDHRLATMDRSGVDMQMISSWIDLTAYALTPDEGSRFSRMYNEGLAGTVAEHPDRFLALSTVPLQTPAVAAAELRFAVGELGMAGVEIAATVDGAELDDRDLDPFWKAAADLRCLVLIHPYNPLAGRNVKRYFLGNAVGRPAETSIGVAHMVMGGVFERYPDLQVCVVHGGGFLPYQAGRLDRAYHAKPGLAAANLSRPPSDWLKGLFYDTVTHSPEVLAFLIEFAGIENVLLGTDFPFEMGDDDPVATVRAIPGLTESDRNLILSGNITRLLEGIRRAG